MTDDRESPLAGDVNQTLPSLRNRIALSRQPEHKLTDNRTFIRGWNAALDHVKKCFKEAMGEKQ